MKKSKIMALVLVVVLAVTSVIGGTYAYLTDRESNVNVFTVGDVSIRLDEDFEQGATLIPGVDINKDVTITNTGKNDAWVWYTYAIPSALDSEDASENVVHINHAGANWLGYQDNEAYWAEGQTEATPENKCWIVDYNPEGNGAPVGTVELEGITYNVYAVLYNGKLPVGETTTVGLTKVYMDPHVDIDPNGDWYHVENGVAEELNWNTNTDGAPLIYVSAYAIQTEGFATVQDAYAAYNAQWTTDAGENNGLEWGEMPEIYTYEGVNYVTAGTSAQINSAGGDTVYRGVLSDGETSATDVKIGEGIVRLNNRALCKAPTITTVTLPSTLTYIDESVFQQSGITEIEIPENVTYIGKQAFGACGSLEKIVIKAKNVTIANYVARACANLKEVYIYSDSVTFESGSMYFTNKENGDASAITFYVKDQAMADTLYNAFSTSHSYGLLIKSLDGGTTYYNTLKTN